VWADVLVDPGMFREPADDTGRLVPVHPPAAIGDKDGAFDAFTDREIHGACCAWSQRYGHGAASFAQYAKRVMAALEPDIVNVGTEGF